MAIIILLDISPPANPGIFPRTLKCIPLATGDFKAKQGQKVAWARKRKMEKLIHPWKKPNGLLG
jgi:hypothetical protein